MLLIDDSELLVNRYADLTVAKFNPDQPRVPAGSPDGGQWGGGPSNRATFNGKPFWSGAVNVLDGMIEEVHSIAEAEDADFHHNMYFSPGQVDSMKQGLSVFFNIEHGGVVQLDASFRGEPLTHQETNFLNQRILEQIVLTPASKKFNPDEPRVPAGSPEGGQWGDGGAGDRMWSRLLPRLAAPDGGFTVHTVTGHEPTTGFAVSIYQGQENTLPVSSVTVARLAQFVADNKQLLAQDNNYFGAWHDPESHTVYLDVAKHVTTRAEALALAQAHGQLAYFDFAAGSSVRVANSRSLMYSEEYYGKEEGRTTSGTGSGRSGGTAQGRSGPVPSTHGQGADRGRHRGSPSHPPESSQALKFNPDEPRVPAGSAEGGEWTSGGGGTATAGPHEVNLQSLHDGAYVRPVPVVTTDINRAIELLAEGQVVELADTVAVHTLLERLAAQALAAQAAGTKAPNINLCNVSVAGTNFFCHDHIATQEYPHGVPRIAMPQLGGVPVPGSDADKLPRNPWDPTEVNGAEAFKTYLKGAGIATSIEVVPAANLRASQAELVGTTVAAMMNDPTFNPDQARNPIFISRDNYVIDGHHRWAALVGRDAADGHLGDSAMNVIRVDAPISEVLHIANDWSARFGIAAKLAKRIWAWITKTACGSCVETEVKYNPDEPRVPAGSPEGGEWSGASADITHEGITSSEQAVRAIWDRITNAPQVQDQGMRDAQAQALKINAMNHLADSLAAQGFGAEMREAVVDGSVIVSGPMDGPYAVSRMTDSQAFASGMIAQWADTSGDHDRHSVATQLAAKAEFGFGTVSHLDDTTLSSAQRIMDAHGSLLRAALRAQYDYTQTQLATQHISELTVFRGMTINANVIATSGAITGVGPMKTTSAPLSSWTVAPHVAEGFTGDQASGVMMAAHIPAKEIFSMPGTGMGARVESEIVVLGRPRTVRATAMTDDDGVISYEQLVARSMKRSDKSPVINIDELLSNADWPKRTDDHWKAVKGSANSGDRGHAGRPGEVGGSAPSGMHVERGFGASDKAYAAVVAQVNAMPEWQRQELVKSKYRIEVLGVLDTVDQELTGAAGAQQDETHRIYIAEKFKFGNKGYVPNPHIKETVIHEMGHALEATGGMFSNENQFREAFQEEFTAMPKATQLSYGHYASTPREAWASMFVYLMGTGPHGALGRVGMTKAQFGKAFRKSLAVAKSLMAKYQAGRK